MNKYSQNTAEKRLDNAGITSDRQSEFCCSPGTGELLSDYVAGILSEPIELEVEEHLLDCLDCRTKHLKMVGIGEALTKTGVDLNESEGTAKILRMPILEDRRAK